MRPPIADTNRSFARPPHRSGDFVRHRTGGNDAGFAVALMRGFTVARSAVFASAVAAISVTRPGAQPSMPSGEEVEYRRRLAIGSCSNHAVPSMSHLRDNGLRAGNRQPK